MKFMRLSLLLALTCLLIAGCGSSNPTSLSKSSDPNLHTSANGVSLSLLVLKDWQAYQGGPGLLEPGEAANAVDYMVGPASNKNCYLRIALRPPRDIAKTPRDFSKTQKADPKTKTTGTLSNGAKWMLNNGQNGLLPLLMVSGPKLSVGYPGWMLGVEVIGQSEVDALNQGDGKVDDKTYQQSQACQTIANKNLAQKTLMQLAEQVQVEASS